MGARHLGGGTPTAAPTTAVPRLDLPGRLLLLDTSTGRLATSAPDGSGFRLLPGPAYPANDASVSQDGSHAIVGGVQVVDPVLLLADEPTAEQDPAHRELVVERLLHRGRPGAGVVLATHDPAIAARCDRVVNLHAGRVVV